MPELIAQILCAVEIARTNAVFVNRQKYYRFYLGDSHVVLLLGMTLKAIAITATQLRYHPNGVRISPHVVRYHCCEATISQHRRCNFTVANGNNITGTKSQSYCGVRSNK